MNKVFLITSILILNLILHSQDILPVQYSFIQPNNINTVIANNGILHYDKWTFPGGDAGFLWPAAAFQRLTAIFASGIYIGAKCGPQRELRLAASWFNSHYTAGNIPVIGQVPPQSVCNDTNWWKVYLVNLNDVSLVNGGTRIKSAGGRNYTFNYTSWANWPVSKGAPFVEVNNIPGYQPGWNSDRPGIGNGSHARPEEICFSVYMDYTNCTNDIHSSEISLPGGTLPLGVEIHQITFGYNCVELRNMLFVKWRIINKSLLSWDSTYVSIVNDMDIGFASDDGFGCDTVRNLGFMYNFDNNDEGNYGINPPACGLRFLQSPLRHTGNNIDTARLPYDTLIGYKMTGLSGANLFRGSASVCLGDPDEAVPGYNFMRGKDGCGRDFYNHVNHQPTSFLYSGDACRRIGWIDSFGADKRFIQNSGPLLMNSGDTQIVVLAYVITRDGGNNYQNVCNMQSYSDSALKYYYNDFQSCIPIGINPVSTDVPERFMLYQNYPNPFNPTTKIRFSIPPVGNGRDRFVQITIYDVLGKEISTLINEELSVGTYEVEWDGMNYSSGIYYYVLTVRQAGSSTDEYSKTMKMVLLK